MKKKFWKKLLIGIGAVLLLIVIALFIYVKTKSEDLPIGQKTEEANLLARKMEQALNIDAWNNTRWVQWSFIDHHYLWDKQNQMCSLSWDNMEVILDLNHLEKSKIKKNKDIQTFDQSTIDKAWSYFCNDSFWLIAPFKTFDPGVERFIVEENNQKALLVTYGSGGVTPGDSYLWYLNEEGIPTNFKMWTSVIPLKGMNATWENWIKTDTGALIASSHDFGGVTLIISDIKTGHSYTDVGLTQAPW